MLSKLSFDNVDYQFWITWGIRAKLHALKIVQTSIVYNIYYANWHMHLQMFTIIEWYSCRSLKYEHTWKENDYIFHETTPLSWQNMSIIHVIEENECLVKFERSLLFDNDLTSKYYYKTRQNNVGINLCCMSWRKKRE